MDKEDYDDPQIEADWLDQQRDRVQGYLKEQGILHGTVASEPAWFLAPYVSIWTTESIDGPDPLGWWVISGDLPTDYLSARNANGAREALREFAKRWLGVSEYMLRGEEHPTVKIGPAENCRELGDLLRRRADILKEWAEDDDMGWNEA